jgi:hypothetical protein
MTDLNHDGQSDNAKGNSDPENNHDIDLTLTPDEEKALKDKIEQLRKRDPFIYR